MSADGFDLAELVTDLAQQLLRNRKQLLPEKIDDLLHNIACRCAIKAHNQTSKEEFEEILRLLSKHEDVKFCPHGRPIAIELTKREIEKQFGRIV
jgi:DNA mismatch repair protein MutL